MLNELLLVGITIWTASQYDPGVMQSVIETRQSGHTAYTIQQDLSHYDGFIAMESCSELGNEYFIRPVGQQLWELFLVTDCSGHNSTSQWMLQNNILIEVDYETALRWNTVGRGIQIEILDYIPQPNLPKPQSTTKPEPTPQPIRSATKSAS
jgi:hypothetical protein